MRFKVGKFTFLGNHSYNGTTLAVIYDRMNEMAMVVIMAFHNGKLIIADAPGCEFGDEEAYKKEMEKAEKESRLLPGKAKLEEREFDDGVKAEEFLFEGLGEFKFDKSKILEKLDKAAAECFQPAKHYGWLSPPRGWKRKPEMER